MLNYNNLYFRIKNFKYMIDRYSATILVKHIKRPDHKNKLPIKLNSNIKKTPVFKEHSYIKSSNPFLL